MYNLDENMPVFSANHEKFGPEFFFPVTDLSSTRSCSPQLSSNSPICPKTPQSVPRPLASLRKNKSALPKPKSAENPSGTTLSATKPPVCRNLFQTVRSEESKQDLKNFLSESIKTLSDIRLQDAESKYNFNFREFKPIESGTLPCSSYSWSLVSRDDQIPDFYRPKQNLEMPRLRDMKNVNCAITGESQDESAAMLEIPSVPSMSSTAQTRSLEVTRIDNSKDKCDVTKSQCITKRNKDVTTKKRKRLVRSNRCLLEIRGSMGQSQITDFLPSVCKKPKMLSGKKL